MENSSKAVVVNDRPKEEIEIASIAELLIGYAEAIGRSAVIVASLDEIAKIDTNDRLIYISYHSARNAIAAKKAHPKNKVFIFTGMGDFEEKNEATAAGIIVVFKSSQTIKKDFVEKILNG
jgi:hypothetical protein